MEATAHINFIVAAYAAAALVVGALVAWVRLDYRAQRRALADLELQGFTRGSSSGERRGIAPEPAKPAAKEKA